MSVWKNILFTGFIFSLSASCVSMSNNSLEVMFDVWEVTGCAEKAGVCWFNEEVYLSFLGKKVEFRKKFLVLNGLRYEAPIYKTQIYTYKQEDIRMEDYPVYFNRRTPGDTIFIVTLDKPQSYHLLDRCINHVVIDQDQLIMDVNGLGLVLTRHKSSSILQRIYEHFRAFVGSAGNFVRKMSIVKRGVRKEIKV